MNQDIHTHLEKLKGELEKLSPAIQHLQKADENTSAVVAAAKNLHKEYAAHLQKIEDLLVATNKDHQKGLSKTIGESVKKMEEATNSFGQIQGEFENTVKLFSDKYKRLADSATYLVKTIEGVDFPNRLDKIDTTISSVNQGLQNVQQRLGDTERNLKDDLQAKSKDIVGRIEGSEKEVKQQLGLIQKENQLLRLLLFVSIAISVVAVIVLVVKR